MTHNSQLKQKKRTAKYVHKLKKREREKRTQNEKEKKRMSFDSFL